MKITLMDDPAPVTESDDQPLIRLTLGDTRVTLLGTAHVSRASAETVARLIDTGDYDSVAIELCETRYKTVTDPNSLAKMDLFEVIRDGKATMIMASLALSAFQQRLADQFGIKPGQEMLVAIEKTRERGQEVELIDREIGATLKRVYKSVPWWQRMGIFTGLIASVISNEKIEEADIEKLKEGDILESTFQEFAETSENIYKPLIDERDRFMADRIFQIQQRQSPDSLLAIVGAGHLAGIKNYLEQLAAKQPPAAEVESELEELASIPPRSKLWKWLPWIIVAVILGGFALGFSRSADLGWDLVKDWVVINGGLSALGALLAAGHPLTVISAFLAAPLTSLNPTIGAGMVTGAVELFLRRPQVEDFGKLKQDTSNWKGWWRNRVSRVLLVFFFSTLGSAAGTYIAGYKIFDKLF